MEHALLTSFALIEGAVGRARRAQLVALQAQLRDGLLALIDRHPRLGWALTDAATPIQPLIVGGNALIEAGTFVAILEVDRFATLRRDIGFRLANHVLSHVAGRVLAELDGCEVGRTGRTSVEFAFRARHATLLAQMLVCLDEVGVIGANPISLTPEG